MMSSITYAEAWRSNTSRKASISVAQIAWLLGYEGRLPLVMLSRAGQAGRRQRHVGTTSFQATVNSRSWTARHKRAASKMREPRGALGRAGRLGARTSIGLSTAVGHLGDLPEA
jgi:hypothetical protein